MKCPTLNDLPKPIEGKTGWPWTEESLKLPNFMPDGSLWPQISIVTPSYNQGEFLEETIRSVLLQNYPNLEYIIIDGGSSDNSLEIIKKYEKWISYWVSEKDGGQAHALNKGFHKAKGLIVGWQNSDDYYGKDACKNCVLVAQKYPDADVFHGTSCFIGENGADVEIISTEDFSLSKRPYSFPLFDFSNQAMFFKRRIFEQGLFLDETYKHAMDNEFFVRLIISGVKFQFVSGLTGTCRVHKGAKTVYQKDIGLIETSRICMATLESQEDRSTIYQCALRGFRTNLVALFRNYQMKEFRIGLYKLIRYGGFNMVDTKLIVRYVISFVGTSIAKVLIRNLHHRNKVLSI
jgi:glycosyltransferase involved in cell wall biosynthesis